MRNKVSFIIIAAVLASACSSGYLRTEDHYEDEIGFAIDAEALIPDTVEHRQVIDVMLQYRSAIVRKDVGTLKSLISTRYYENGGTTHTTRDDYGTPELDAVFERYASHSDQIRYDIVLKAVEVTDRTAIVDYEYQYAFQYKVGEDVAWDAGLDVNRLALEAEGDGWKIVSGL